jgi:hypothetical protein
MLAMAAELGFSVGPDPDDPACRRVTISLA